MSGLLSPEQFGLFPRPLESARRVCPEGAEAIDRAQSLAYEKNPVISDLIVLRVSQMLGFTDIDANEASEVSAAKRAALVNWPQSDLFDEAEKACLALAEQMIIDVSGVTDLDVSRVVDALGSEATFGVVQTIHVADQSVRLRHSTGFLDKKES